MEVHNNWNEFMGIVVEDRKLKSRMIKVYLKEMTPFMSGPLEDMTASEDYSLKDDITKGELSGSVKTTNWVTAEYFGTTTNRSFPPDVVKGEQVLIYRYLDTDIYFWESFGRNDDLRRGEILRFGISDDMSVIKNLSDGNTYFFEMDTRVNKRVRIHTSDSDGEDHTYDIQIDAKNSFVTIADDIGNKFILESNVPRIKLLNSDGTMIDMVEETINMYAPKDIVIKADNDVVIKAGHDFVWKAENMAVGVSKLDTKIESEEENIKMTAEMNIESTAMMSIINEATINIEETAGVMILETTPLYEVDAEDIEALDDRFPPK